MKSSRCCARCGRCRPRTCAAIPCAASTPRAHRRRAGARLPAGRRHSARQPHRDLCRDARRAGHVALEPGAVLPAHRQAHAGARDRGGDQFCRGAAFDLRRRQHAAAQPHGDPAAAGRVGAAHADGQAAGRGHEAQAAEPGAEPRLGLHDAPRRSLRAFAARRDPRTAGAVRAARRTAGRMDLGRPDPGSLAPPGRGAAALHGRHLGPAASSAFMAREGVQWSEEA